MQKSLQEFFFCGLCWFSATRAKMEERKKPAHTFVPSSTSLLGGTMESCSTCGFLLTPARARHLSCLGLS